MAFHGPWVVLVVLVCHMPWGTAMVHTDCTKVYHPSPLEQRWLRNIGQWQSEDVNWAKGCAAWKEDAPAWDLWRAYMNLSRASKAPGPMPEAVFSYHTVECNQTAMKQQRLKRRFATPSGATVADLLADGPQKMYIEPLASFLRSPWHFCGGEDMLFDTSWLVFPWHTPYRQAFFFDLGSTVFDAGVNGYTDSLAWFLESYERRGWQFSHIFAWELKPVDQADYWRRVPTKYKSRLHFFNTGCSDAPGSDMNPLRFVETLTRPHDYVVFKLDIDNNPIEVSLVMQILKSPRLMALIDEIYWENHVKGSPVQWMGWGNMSDLTGNCSDLEGSYQTFYKLRQAGIRAHSWV